MHPSTLDLNAGKVKGRKTRKSKTTTYSVHRRKAYNVNHCNDCDTYPTLAIVLTKTENSEAKLTVLTFNVKVKNKGHKCASCRI